MKHTPILTALALAACTQPEPIEDYDAPMGGKYGYAAPEASPTPLHRAFLPCVAYPVISDDGNALYLTRRVLSRSCYSANGNDDDGNGRVSRREQSNGQHEKVCSPKSKAKK